jgi:hypothetical protein
MTLLQHWDCPYDQGANSHFFNLETHLKIDIDGRTLSKADISSGTHLSFIATCKVSGVFD